MTRLVKKAAAAKNIPLLALALFAAVFFGSEALASFEVQGAQKWLHNDDPECPTTNPDCYTLYDGEDELDDLCDNVAGICGIAAPRDMSIPPTQPARPEIDTDLEDKIENENTSTNEVFLKPFAN